jgi:hypothetical protein
MGREAEYSDASVRAWTASNQSILAAGRMLLGGIVRVERSVV